MPLKGLLQVAVNRRPRILLADDHTMLLDAFKRVLEPAYQVVGSVVDGRALLEVAPGLAPDVIILDVAMPGLSGFEAARRLRLTLPRTRLVFLTSNEDPDLALEAFGLGASAYLLKSSASSELFTAIQSALVGRIYVTPKLTRGMPIGVFLSQQSRRGGEKLTDRQREVLGLLAAGHAMKEVAELLNVSPRTVAFHKYTMMENLGIKTSAGLVKYAVQHGIIPGQ